MYWGSCRILGKEVWDTGQQRWSPLEGSAEYPPLENFKIEVLGHSEARLACYDVFFFNLGGLTKPPEPPWMCPRYMYSSCFNRGNVCAMPKDLRVQTLGVVDSCGMKSLSLPLIITTPSGWDSVHYRLSPVFLTLQVVLLGSREVSTARVKHLTQEHNIVTVWPLTRS